MSDILSPAPKLAFFDSNGAPLSGGKLFTYAAGTVNKQDTYTDSTGLTPNTNPIVLNARGECDCWLDPTLLYKFVLSPSTDTDPPTNPIWTVDNVGNTVVIAGQISKLGSVAGTNAYTATSAYAVSAYADGMVYLFVPSATNTGAVTINVSGLGPKNVYVAGNPCAGGEFQAGIAYLIEYSNANSRFDLLNALQLPTGSALFQTLATNNNGTNPNTQIDISASKAILTNSSGQTKDFGALSITVDITVSGAGGLDTGAEAANTWYYLWGIGKLDGTKSALISASSSAPTLPSGYTYKGLMGCFRNDGSSNIQKFYQRGNRYIKGELVFVSMGAPTSFTVLNIATLLPPIATSAIARPDFIYNADGSGIVQIIWKVSIDGTNATEQCYTYAQGLALTQSLADRWRADIPNVGQQIYHEFLISNGTVSSAALYVPEFNMPVFAC